MTTPRNAVGYAETTLGVHTEFEKTESLIRELDAARRRHLAFVHEVRNQRLGIESLEQELAEKVRIENPDITSAAAFDRKLKEVIAADELHGVNKYEIVNAMRDADAAEAEVRDLELKVKLGLGRMSQTGDFMRFLAAHTEARTENRRRAFDPVNG